MMQLQFINEVLFDIGDLYITRSIQDLLTPLQVMSLVNRHRTGDFGCLCTDDKTLNTSAIQNGQRIFSAYKTSKGKIYVITESDRSSTTVMLPEEY